MSEFFYLARCKEISTEKGKFKFPPGFILLASVEEPTYLVALFAENMRKSQSSQLSKERFFQFNGKKCSKVLSIPFNVSETVYFSKAISILYESTKKNGGGDGELNLFRHQFGKTVHLWTNPEKTVYILGGRNLIVTDRGIEH